MATPHMELMVFADAQAVAQQAAVFIAAEARRAVAARGCYLRAARMTASVPEQRYLELRAARLHDPAPPAGQAD